MNTSSSSAIKNLYDRKEKRRQNYDTKVNKNIESFQFAASGTSEYVDALFQKSNMKKVLLNAIHDSGNDSRIGCLSCGSLNENDVIEMRKSGKANDEAKMLIETYREDIDEYQRKYKKLMPIFVTNFAMSTRIDYHHYCAFWIDTQKKKCYIWDSASSGHKSSIFYQLFHDSAYFLLGPPGLNLIKEFEEVISTPSHYSFQNGGGFYGSYGSELHQNIYCHTWTLFFLELRIFGLSMAEIACLRGSHPLLPLTLIKMYSQCLLYKLKVVDPKIYPTLQEHPQYSGLTVVWNSHAEKTTPCPTCDYKNVNTLFGGSCALNAIDIVDKAGLITQSEYCKRLVLNKMKGIPYKQPINRHRDQD